MKRVAGLVAVMVSAIGLGGAVAGGAAPDPGPWSVVTLPLPADANAQHDVTLGKGACGAPGRCVIPGSYLTNTNKTEGLIETVSNGVPTAQALPAPAEAPADPRVNLVKAACPTSGRCVAVGNYELSGGPLVGELVWQTASGWRAITAPAPAGYEGAQIILNDVTCVGGVCFGVGTVRAKPLVERFANGTWTPTALPPVPGPGALVLETVSCSSSRHCVAAGRHYVGTSGRMLGAPGAAIWNGTTWTTTILPQPADAADRDFDQLPTISACVAGGTCHVLSAYPPLNGPPRTRPADYVNDANGWTSTGLPDGKPVANNATPMYDIHCSAPRSCVAVGQALNRPGYGTIATLSSAGWSVTYAPGPGGTSDQIAFSALNCLPDESCTAFGLDSTGYVATALTSTPTTTSLPNPPDLTYHDGKITTAMYDGTRQLAAGTYSTSSAQSGALWMRTV